MNSLPDYSHTQKSFSKIKRPCQSFENVPLHDSDINLSCFKKIKSNEFIQKRPRKGSNMLELAIKEKNMYNILFSVLKNILFPNFVAFLFICLMIKFEDHMHLDCYDGDNYYSYFFIRNALFLRYFYYWGVGLCFFFEEKHHKLFNFINFILVLAILFGIYCSPIIISDFVALSIPLLFQVIFYLILKFWKGKLNKVVLIRICFIIIVFSIAFFDMNFLRLYLIEQIYVILKESQNQKIFFQCFLFFFYQIHGTIFLSVITRFRSNIPKNLFLFLIKYYLVNVLSSCTTLSIVYSKERFFGIFTTFNFITQLLSLYLQENILLHIFYSLLELLKKKRVKFVKKKEQANSDIKSIIAGFTNETMYTITFTLLTIILFEKTFQHTFYDYGHKKRKKFCVTNFEGVATFIPYNLCILFAINFFYFFYLLFKMKDNNKIKFLWKRENYSFVVRIYLIILFQGNADMNFQFFMYLNLLDNNIINDPNL